MSVTIYGIKNCDTIKKARRFMDDNNIDYHFHDYRVDGTDKNQLQGWIAQFGWDTVLNKRGTTWRKLSDDVRDNTNEQNAADLLTEEPAMIKRPVLVTGDKVLVGFKESDWKEALL
jgi:arsenate reductase